jgi:hypothetical protein
MKRIFFTILILSIIISGCKKDYKPQLSGTITIDNLLTLSGTGAYYALGFSVPDGKKVSTLNDPLNVISILADADINDNVRKIFFATISLRNSFYMFGQYPDAASASLAFKNLTSFTDRPWTEIGDSVKTNQIWLYRTSSDRYAKIRVTNTVGEKRNNKAYAECTFEWVYQPDGSLTFPVK